MADTMTDVERVARALFDASETTIDDWTGMAQAAIACLRSLGFVHRDEARREAIEECAKVAENFPALTHGNLATAPVFAAEQAADEIAAAIRALAVPDETQKPRQPGKMTGRVMFEDPDASGGETGDCPN
jgi:hypothetical protein